MLIAIFTWQIVGDYFLNIVSLWELNGLKLGKKQYIVAIYQTDIRYISVQVWNCKCPRPKLEVLRKPCSTDMVIAAHAIA